MGVWFFLLLGANAETRSFEDIEKAAIAQRQAIKTGRVVVEVKREAEKLKYQYVSTLWCGGDAARSENEAVFSGRKQRRIACSPCMRPTTCISWPVEHGKHQSFVTLELISKKDRVPVIDLRAIGLVPAPWGVMRGYSARKAISPLGRMQVGVEEGTWEGKKCWALSSRLPRNKTHKLWVVPEMGNSVVKAVVEWTDKGSTYVSTISSTMKLHRDSGIWFPERTRISDTQDGKEYASEELTVKEAEFNIPLPESTFTFVGLGLPAGTTVQDDSDGGKLLTWDGKELVPHPSATKPVPMEPMEPVPTERGWLVWLSRVFGLLAVASIGYFVHRRRLAAREAES